MTITSAPRLQHARGFWKYRAQMAGLFRTSIPMASPQSALGSQALWRCMGSRTFRDSSMSWV